MRGFTLIELMIVVAILAILTAVALPSYQNQVRDSRRADAVSVLMQSRQLLERYYSKNYTYANAPAGTVPTKSPIDGGVTYYSIALVSGASTFTLTATPQGGQAGDTCGALVINQAGVKLSGGGTIDTCWR